MTNLYTISLKSNFLKNGMSTAININTCFCYVLTILFL